MKVTRRHLKMLMRLFAKTRVNKDLLKFAANIYKRQRLDRMRDCQIPYPTTIMLELTNICNLHCTTCARESADGRRMALGIMEPDKVYRIIDEVYPYLLSIGLTGMGETFLNPHLIDVARYVKSKKPSIVTSCSTNANFPDAVSRIVPVLDYIDTLQISIDGIGETYERIRKGGSFSTFESNLNQIVRQKPDNTVIMLNMVITRDNYHQIPDVIDFASDHKIEYLNFNYYNLVCAAHDRSYYEFFSTKDFLDVRAVAESKIAAVKGLEVTGLDFPGSPSFRKCPFFWDHLYITWDGYMVPCCSKPFPKIYNFGNVFDSDVISVINSDKFCNYRRLWQNNTPPPFCNKCHFIDL